MVRYVSRKGSQLFFPVGERLGSSHRVGGADPSRHSEGASIVGVFFVSPVGL